MKEGIHPQYFKATAHCSGCGATFETGSTVEEIKVSVCSACHPFFTGKQKLMDTEGRVDRFKRKYAQAQDKARELAEKKATGKPAA